LPNQTESLPVNEGISPEVIAVISAAAATVLDKKVRVVHIRRSITDTAWQRQGRVTIMSSHVIRR